METVTTQMREIADQHESEVLAGERFEFGKNWSAFLAVLDEGRIVKAEESLREMLEVEDLRGKTFLDIGSGSGLFSLAARRLGATVHSFDYDSNSYNCTKELKRRFYADDENWRVEQGSALDKAYVESLGAFDIVYSWGVLHHTGAMYRALENVLQCTRPDGLIAIAIYNDQGARSSRWARVKRVYCGSEVGKALALGTIVPYWVGRGLLSDLLRARNPAGRYRDYRKRRGMSFAHDWVDWLGGWPFEVAKPEEIFRWFRDRGYTLLNLTTAGGTMGCNEFVFRRAQRT